MLEVGQPRFLETYSLSHSLKHLLPEALYPYKPENYMLMSDQNAITDWHVDCTGSAVFYQVLSGVKEIVFVEPSPLNKQLFSEYLVNGK